MTEKQHPDPNKRRRRRRYGAGITFLLLVVASLVTAQLTNARVPLPKLPDLPSVGASLTNAQPGLYKVVQVTDGDTIKVATPNGQETVRFLGVDTPEVKDPRKPVQCFGQAASAHTHSKLDNASVRLEPDPQDTDRDKYGRILRYVYLPDGTLYNAELIREGYAFAYTVFPITKLDEFRALEREARENNRGLWAGCNVNETSKIKQTTGTK